MKLHARIVLMILAPIALIHGCNDGNKPKPEANVVGSSNTDTAAQPPASDGSTPAAGPATTATPAAGAMRGTVRETMDSGGYSYMQVETGTGSVWAAANQMKVAVGDTVELIGGMPMQDFYSRTLDRTFDVILFVSSAAVMGNQAATDDSAGQPAKLPPIDTPGNRPKPGEPPAVQPGRIEKLPDGHTVADLFEKKADLAGKTVRIRARVVKASRGIMGKNWLHIQDGTGQPGKNDITVTSAAGFAEVGSTVIVEGTFAIDKDIGAGYFFPVIIEDAKITLES